MKRYTLVAVTVLACLVLQASTMPDRTMQEKAQDLLDRMKASAQEAVEHAQEAAARAVDSAKIAVQDAMQAAQQATQQGLETGREWVEYGKSVAANFSNQTIVDKVETKQME